MNKLIVRKIGRSRVMDQAKKERRVKKKELKPS